MTYYFRYQWLILLFEVEVVFWQRWSLRKGRKSSLMLFNRLLAWMGGQNSSSQGDPFQLTRAREQKKRYIIPLYYTVENTREKLTTPGFGFTLINSVKQHKMFSQSWSQEKIEEEIINTRVKYKRGKIIIIQDGNCVEMLNLLTSSLTNVCMLRSVIKR